MMHLLLHKHAQNPNNLVILCIAILFSFCFISCSIGEGVHILVILTPTLCGHVLTLSSRSYFMLFSKCLEKLQTSFLLVDLVFCQQLIAVELMSPLDMKESVVRTIYLPGHS